MASNYDGKRELDLDTLPDPDMLATYCENCNGMKNPQDGKCPDCGGTIAHTGLG